MNTNTSYKPMFYFGADEIQGNAQAFATYAEAEASAQARFRVWTMTTGFCVHESNEAVNYRWDKEKGDVRLQSTVYKQKREREKCQPISYSNATIATVVERYDTATMVAQKVRLTHANTAKGRALNGAVITTLRDTLCCQMYRTQ